MRVLMLHSNFRQRNVIKQPWNITYQLALNLSRGNHKIIIFTDVHDKVDFKNSKIEIKYVNYGLLRSKINKLKPALKESDILIYFGNPLSGIYLSKLKDIYQPLVLFISSVPYTFSELRRLSLRDLESNWIHLFFSIFPFSYFFRLLNKNIINKIIVPNNIIKNRLVKCGVSGQKILVFPVGFDKMKCPTHEREPINIRESVLLSSKEFIIAYLGPPSTIRGTDTIIKAAHLLKNYTMNFKVLLLLRVDSKEEAKDENYLRFLINKLDLSDKFYITSGVLSQEKMREYLYTSDVIVLPFKIVQSEPPISILECMEIGKPIITTSTCGLPEIIGTDRGVLVKPNSPQDLALAIYKLYLNVNLRNSIGEKARKFMSLWPDWAYVSNLYESLFQELIYKKRKL